jgi:hypothetical protein
MPDPRIHLAGTAVQLAKNGDSRDNIVSPEPSPAREQPEAEREQYIAISPSGSQLEIPKELFVALSDFMKTRKCPGSITVHFRKGEIICVEAIAKKTYR